ncbi:unnamed protein product, partial [Medioppia subpectinata]
MLFTLKSDVYHAYQVIHSHGIPDENIIVMHYDDIAFDTSNPTPGIIINKYGGPDVYEGVPKDYTGEDVTPQNFLGILRGDEELVKKGKRVLKSSPNDRGTFLLWLHRTGIDELPANAFAGLQFKSIQIHLATALHNIHRHAFNGTDNYTTHLYIIGAPVSERVDREWDLFGAIHSLHGLQVLQLDNTSVRAVPTHAISGHHQLQWIHIYRSPIITIATQAFNDLPNLVSLDIRYTMIDSVAERAFTVGTVANYINKLDLNLIGVSLTAESFADRAFDGMNRSAYLSLSDNSVRYLKRESFEAFLSNNSYIVDSTVDCNDSRNHWIKEKFPDEWE